MGIPKQMGTTYMTAELHVKSAMQDSFDTTIEFDKDAARAWIELVHGTSPGLIHICSVGNWVGRTFSEPSDAVDYAERLNQAEGIYMRTTTLARPLRDGSRGGAADSLALPGFAADIDLAGPGHKHDPSKHNGLTLPGTVADAELIVTTAGLPVPTIWVHSGGGVYPWWIFETPVVLGEDEGQIPWAVAEETSRKLHELIAHAARKLGWFYGTGVHDIARVLRLPGTVNRKEGLARPCRVLDPASYEFTAYADVVSLVDELTRALPAPAAPEPSRAAKVPGPVDGGLSPGDDFELRTSWWQILAPHGWNIVYKRGNTTHWRRPGKDHGTPSATTGHDPARDRLFVFSDESAPFPVREPVTKFYAHALLNHGGDVKAAASELRTLGYGSALPEYPKVKLQDLLPPREAPAPQTAAPEPTQAVPAAEVPTQTPVFDDHEILPTDVGNGERMKALFGDEFRYHSAQKTWYRWKGDVWRPDEDKGVERAAKAMTQHILAQSKVVGNTDAKAGQRLYRWGVKSQDNARINAAVARFMAEKGVTVGPEAFNQRQELVTCTNGVLNYETGEFGVHDPALLLTRSLNVAFDKDARCPQFLQFLADVQPEQAMQRYLQKAIGYTLAGRVDQRALFILYGPPKTGKSQFLKLMTKIFGDFGLTASPSAFRVTKGTQTNDLHGLRGKRFVATSESSESTQLDEEVIKALTGQDARTTRDLYEKNQTWLPECTVWMATNIKPILNAGDPAIWTRMRPIEFATQFSPKGEHKEVLSIADRLFDSEASGILNWMLEGVRLYLEEGLENPETVEKAVEAYRLESDNVAIFVTESLDEGTILPSDPTGDCIRSNALFQIYLEWSSKNGYRRTLNNKNFIKRMENLGYQRKKDSVYYWIGIKSGSAGLLGRM